MLAIRFNRFGKKNRASFRIVLQEKSQAPGRRHVEILGSYDPHSKGTVLKSDRITYWIGKGAEVSDSVHNLLVREGVVKAGKKAIKMVKPAPKEEPKAEEAPAESAEAGEKVGEDEAPSESGGTEKKAEEAPAEEEKKGKGK